MTAEDLAYKLKEECEGEAEIIIAVDGKLLEEIVAAASKSDNHYVILQPIATTEKYDGEKWCAAIQCVVK